MAILRFKKEPTPVVFRDGIRGTETSSSISGEREWQHFVNQYRDSKDTIYLSEEAQAQLTRLSPSSSETVLIGVATINREKRTFLKIAEASDAKEPPPASGWEPKQSFGHSADQQRRDEDGGPQATYTPLPHYYEAEATKLKIAYEAEAAKLRIAAAAQAAKLSTPPAAAPAEIWSQERLDMHEARKEQARQEQARQPKQSAEEILKSYSPDPHATEKRMMACALVAGIEAARLAEQATGISFSLQDLRSIGISVYIEACRARRDAEDDQRTARANRENAELYAATAATPADQRRRA